MSATVDAERKSDAELARYDRAIRVLEELLRVVRAKREGLPNTVIAERNGRHRRTIYERQETLEKLLVLVASNSAGSRRRE